MRPAISSYSFSRLLSKGEISLWEAMAKARAFGCEAMEFSGLPTPAEQTAVQFADRVKAACAEAGLAIASYTIGADFLNAEGGDWKREVERLRNEARVAQALGAPLMRHDATRGFNREYRGRRGFSDALAILAPACRQVTEFAADLGVRTMVENHGFFCQDSERVESLINAVDHPNFGALIDIGNFLCADEEPTKAVGRLAPYAFHCHVKDFHVKSGSQPEPGEGWFQSRAGNWLRGAIVGHGEVPVQQCLRILAQNGYRGFVSLEFEGLEEPLTGIRLGLGNLKRFLAGISV